MYTPDVKARGASTKSYPSIPPCTILNPRSGRLCGVRKSIVKSAAARALEAVPRDACTIGGALGTLNQTLPVRSNRTEALWWTW